MSEKHQMPGYRPSALGLATKVRIGEPGIEMSAYSVVTIICWLEESLAKRHEPVNPRLRLLRFSSLAFARSTTFPRRFAQWAWHPVPPLRSGGSLRCRSHCRHESTRENR